ncbi:hypothetical protein EDB19DRAFT_1755871, partial [Suillus lakei]
GLLCFYSILVFILVLDLRLVILVPVSHNIYLLRQIYRIPDCATRSASLASSSSSLTTSVAFEQHNVLVRVPARQVSWEPIHHSPNSVMGTYCKWDIYDSCNEEMFGEISVTS